LFGLEKHRKSIKKHDGSENEEGDREMERLGKLFNVPFIQVEGQNLFLEF
jgi:hypothetical protein